MPIKLQVAIDPGAKVTAILTRAVRYAGVQWRR
jgi:hypothetical protein